MSFDEFINKYDGKAIDWDGNYGPQCVDLYRQYVKEVLSFPQSPPVPGAKDIWDTYLPEYFKRIENTPTGVPEKGDVVIFGTGLGRYGHVSIFIEGTTSKFTSFDQNYPLGSLCHRQGHTYSGVIGWLTPLKKAMDIPEWFKTLLLEKNLSLEREGEFRSFWEKAVKYDDEIRGLQEQVKSANEALADRALEVSVLTEKNQKLSDKITETQELNNQLRSKNDTLTWESTKLELENKKLQEENLKLQEKIEKLESDNSLFGYSWWTRFKSLFQRR